MAIQPVGTPPTGVPVVTNTPVQVPIDIVPPVIAQGAANARGIGEMAGHGTVPMNTPLYSGGSTMLAQLSTGAATMKSIP
jgi:hypothetical protein